MEKFNKLQTTLDAIKEDAKKFYEKGNGAAGTRLRKGMLDLRELATEVRKEVSEKKNAE